MSETRSQAVALSNTQIESFCHKHGLEYCLLTLEQLNASAGVGKKFCFIFTGNNKDEYNNGYHNHWLFKFANYLFDSYGYQSQYKLPPNLKSITNHPTRLQSFGSDVCGEYCCVFYLFVKTQGAQLDFRNIGEHFSNYYGLGTNREENDKKILATYRGQNKQRQSSSSGGEEVEEKR